MVTNFTINDISANYGNYHWFLDFDWLWSSVAIMVVTIVCRDTINCKVTIVLCNGAQIFLNLLQYIVGLCVSPCFFRDCALTWNLTNVERYAWWNIDCQAADTEMLKLKLELPGQDWHTWYMHPIMSRCTMLVSSQAMLFVSPSPIKACRAHTGK